MMPELQIMHNTEKVRDTTLDDENASQHLTSVLVTALCNQPKAYALDLSDDQSRHLFQGFISRVTTSETEIKSFQPLMEF